MGMPLAVPAFIWQILHFTPDSANILAEAIQAGEGVGKNSQRRGVGVSGSNLPNGSPSAVD